MFVQFETPKELGTQTYEVLEKSKATGKIAKGANEVTKQIERGMAKLVIMAEDVSPPEILAHIPLLAEEKGVAFGYVPSKAELGASVGLPVGTAAVAILDAGTGSEALAGIVDQFNALKN